MIVFDVETNPKGSIVIIGVIKDNKYFYFNNAEKFFKWIKKNKVREIFAHNLEFDFFKCYEEYKNIKFKAYFSSFGLCYVQAGRVFYKDLMNHLPFGLKKIGKMIGLPKLKFNYKKLWKITPELIKYNKRDCEITYKALKELEFIYRQEGSKIKATLSSVAMQVFLKKFYRGKFKRIEDIHLQIFRRGYKGGSVIPFITGAFKNKKFYKIDCNSMYSFAMNLSYPNLEFKVVRKLNKKDRNSLYWLGVNIGKENIQVFNSIEHRQEVCHYYYVFTKKIYPFCDYVKHFFKAKTEARLSGDKLLTKVYKDFLNRLYGKFAQKPEISIISNYLIKESKNVVYREQYIEGLDRIIYLTDNKFWINVIWSLFTTARVRFYMANIYKYLVSKGMTVYYTDTDSFIISGDIRRIKNLISEKTIGLFKIEDIANNIDIRGKKFYSFGSIFKCKGLPKKYRKEFFKKGYVEYEKMTRLKESVVRGVKLGVMIKTHKTNRRNK